MLFLLLGQNTKSQVDIPQWLHACAEKVLCDSRAQSIVLFGSRATGYARDDSDWDIAVVHSQNEGDWRWTRRLLSPSTTARYSVDLVPLSQIQYSSRRNAIGSLAYEIAHNGVLIAGKSLLKPLSTEYDMIDTTEITIHLVNTYKNLARTINELLTEHTKDSRIERGSTDDASRFSGDTAEYLAKALCVYCETGYDKTHDFRQLAQKLPETWRNAVIAMNGDNPSRHTQQYNLFVETGEVIGDVIDRVSVIFTVLDQSVLLMVAKLPAERQSYLADVLEERRTGLLRAMPQEDIDPSYEPCRSLLASYTQQAESIFNYISIDAVRGASKQGASQKD